MWIIVLMTLVAAPIAIVHGVGRKRWAFRVAAALAASILAVGAYGTWSGRALTERVVKFPGIDPKAVPGLLEEGYREAWRSIEFGGTIALALLVLLVIGRMRPPRETSTRVLQ